ncbi:MAG: nucleotide sugar dehydrogenase [Chloroflexi bacterium]|nr:nucleotide sugar dehydrogenase [Chloroflexota bacterium]MCI0795298.1 nucleotide sugar dehydrogenase [Chloroflexota bacterium]
MNRRNLLLRGDLKIGIWGVGHIGYSTMCHFAERGVSIVGFDIDVEKAAAVNRGESAIFAMDYWLGFSPGYLFKSGQARVTTDWEEMMDPEISVHFICIPTERHGQPWLEPLMDVCRKLAVIKDRPRSMPPLVIIESTLTPTTTDQHIIPFFEQEGIELGKDLLLGCAPRRDWFSSPDKSLTTLPRIFGGMDDATAEQMHQVLSIVCQNLVKAPTHFYAEVVKSIENAYRHTEIALAFELSRAYPNMDMRTVLELVGTKWNVGTFHPSFGVGGYCIPLSSYYVIEGAEKPEELNILRQAIATCEDQPELLAQSLIQRGVRKVGILGLSYTENVKVWAQSPTLALSAVLAKVGIGVKVHDPNFTAEEIYKIAGTDTFDFPDDLDEFDAVLLVAGHREYRLSNHRDILPHLSNCRLVLDNSGFWKEVDFDSKGIEYFVPGNAHWMNGVGSETASLPTAPVGD